MPASRHDRCPHRSRRTRIRAEGGGLVSSVCSGVFALRGEAPEPTESRHFKTSVPNQSVWELERPGSWAEKVGGNLRWLANRDRAAVASLKTAVSLHYVLAEPDRFPKIAMKLGTKIVRT